MSEDSSFVIRHSPFVIPHSSFIPFRPSETNEAHVVALGEAVRETANVIENEFTEVGRGHVRRT
jgi:hypothetical protein